MQQLSTAQSGTITHQPSVAKFNRPMPSVALTPSVAFLYTDSPVWLLITQPKAARYATTFYCQSGTITYQPSVAKIYQTHAQCGPLTPSVAFYYTDSPVWL